MAYQEQLISLLEDVVRSLLRAEFNFTLAGGLAFSALVHPRTTEDLDFLILLDKESRPRLLSSLSPLFERIFSLPEPGRFEKALILSLTGMKANRECVLDFLIADSDFHVNVLARKVELPFQGLLLPLVTPEDLLILKSMSNRLQDRADIEQIRLFYAQRLDEPYINKWLRELNIVAVD